MISVKCNGIWKMLPFGLTVMADSKEEACKKFKEEVEFDVSVQGACEM